MSQEITLKEYRTEVTDIAKSCIVAAKEEDRELSDVIWDVCDSHQWVIYTYYQHQVLQHTSTDVAERFEELGGPGLTTGWNGIVAQAAFLALEGDVLDRAQELEQDEP